MKKLVLLIFCFLCFLSNTLASSIVMDIDSKRIFYQDNISEKKLIASTTKIMTAIIAIESNRLEDIVKANEEILKMYGSNIYLELNENMLLIDLIYGLLLRSGNDAAIVIANHVAGSEEKFVKLMNKKAKELSLSNTSFNNPHGLDDETKNYSTAYDLAILYSYAYQNPIFRKIIGEKYYETESDLKTYTWKNRSELLFLYENTTGGKTGYTPDAGRIFVSSATNNDLNICIVTFSNSYKYNFHKAKYEEIFSEYQNRLILDKNNFYILGVNDAYIKESFSYPLTNMEYQNIQIKTNINEMDNVLGEVYVYLDDEVIYKTNIYKKLKKENIFFKIINYFKTKLANKD